MLDKCPVGVSQWTNTCYFNAILNGMLYSTFFREILKKEIENYCQAFPHHYHYITMNYEMEACLRYEVPLYPEQKFVFYKLLHILLFRDANSFLTESENPVPTMITMINRGTGYPNENIEMQHYKPFLFKSLTYIFGQQTPQRWSIIDNNKNINFDIINALREMPDHIDIVYVVLNSVRLINLNFLDLDVLPGNFNINHVYITIESIKKGAHLILGTFCERQQVIVDSVLLHSKIPFLQANWFNDIGDVYKAYKNANLNYLYFGNTYETRGYLGYECICFTRKLAQPGGALYKKAPFKKVVQGRERVIYFGARNKQYIKMKGIFVPVHGAKKR